MKLIFTKAISLMLMAFFISGCISSIKLAIPPAQTVSIQPGIYTVNGIDKSVPWDTTYFFSKGNLDVSQSDFKLEPLIGADLVGLNASPWAGLRFVHVMNIGVDCGFDKENFTTGIDWLWHDVAIGPNMAFPYDLSNNHFGFKMAFLF